MIIWLCVYTCLSLNLVNAVNKSIPFATTFNDTLIETDIAPNLDNKNASESSLDEYDDEETNSEQEHNNSFGKSINKFLDSAINLMTETRNEFSEELNKTHSNSAAKSAWIAYSNTWQKAINSAFKYAMPRLLESSGDYDISNDCLTGLFVFVTALQNQKDWAVKMLDSFGRPPTAGMLDGSIISLGAYDQCLAINSDFIDQSIVGQYCIIKYTLVLPPRPKQLTIKSSVFDFSGTPVHDTYLEEFSRSAQAFYDHQGRVGACIPSTCTGVDVEKIITQFIGDNRFRVSVNDCHIKESIQFNSLQIVIIAVLSLIGFFMIVATSVDLILQYTIKKLPPPLISYENRLKRIVISFVVSFSVYTNGKQLFNTKNTNSNLIESVNGVRVLSMAWIVWTHTYLLSFKDTFLNGRQFMLAIEGIPFQFILNGWVLVDSFFLVGALLATMSHLNVMKKSDGRINVLQIIFNRFFRFLPSVLLTVMITFVVPSLASGPLWHEYFDYQLDKCYNYWWATISFINNWYNESNMCLLHTWYLSADMQLFILAIFFVIRLYKSPKLGTYLLTMAALGSCLAILIRTYLLRQPPTVLYLAPGEREVLDAVSTVHVHTYIHLGPYFVGVFLGYLLFNKRNYQISLTVNLLLWLLALMMALAVMVGTCPLNRGQKWPLLSLAIYAGFHRTAWALSLGWIVFACATGNGGPINTFLSWKFFAPLSKLSFMIYLMHFLVIWFRYAYARQPLPFSHYTLFCEFIVNLVISTLISIVTYLAVEAPAMALHRHYLSNIFKCFGVRVCPTKPLSYIESVKESATTSKL